MSKKLGQSSAEEQLRILNQLDEEKIPRLMHIENYNRYNMTLIRINCNKLNNFFNF